jgi:hypothetical protein
MCNKRKVGDYFFPELLVKNIFNYIHLPTHFFKGKIEVQRIIILPVYVSDPKGRTQIKDV